MPVECLIAAAATAVTATTAATACAPASAAAVTAATTATTSAAAVTATATSATTEAATTSAGRTGLHRTGFVHHEATATVLLTVHAVDSSLCLSVAAHFHKAEALGAAGVTFHHDLGASDGTVCGKCLLQVFVTESVGQVAHVKFVAHERTPQNNSKRDGVQNRYYHAINKRMKT